MPETRPQAVGFLGGTGPLGRGLALRLAVSGVDVLLGSRDQSRGREIAADLSGQLPPGSGEATGASNREVLERCALVLITIPYQAMGATLEELRPLAPGRILVSTAVPMEFLGGVPHPVTTGFGSATEQVAQLCPDSLVVGAFHTVAAGQLLKLDHTLDEDVLLTAHDSAAKERVSDLVERIPGLRPVDAGSLDSARFCEQLTPLLLRLNRLHRAHTGIRITGL
ncbi:MAG: NADPH-dependent F420 reductase [Candidatus Dormibacteraeota bacterium]|nr:NADPH-dependent F420 reductase [Candidatus Dormibacteraeota bacterium]